MREAALFNKPLVKAHTLPPVNTEPDRVTRKESGLPVSGYVPHQHRMGDV